MTSPALSVVVPTYNRAHLLKATLASLARQSIGVHRFEVHVVDDGSVDGTRQLVSQWRSMCVLYAYQEDKGYRVAAARNIGIRAARAPICVFLDSGMLAAPDFLEGHLNAHRCRAGPVCVIGSIAGLDQHGHGHHGHNDNAIRALIDDADPEGSFMRLERMGYGDIREHLFYQRYGDDLAEWPAPWVVFWTGNASAPTTVLRQVGLFDEAYTTWGGEDTDLGIRLHRAGAIMVLDRRARAVHVPHAKALAHLAPREREAARQSTLQRLHASHRSHETLLLQRVPLEDLNDCLAADGRSPANDRMPGSCHLAGAVHG